MLDFKYSFKQVDSFSRISCCFEVIEIETNQPITTMVFGYCSQNNHFYICQAGALWCDKDKNFGTTNRTYDSTVFRRIVKEMICLFNLLGVEFVKPAAFTESYIREKHEEEQEPIFLYSSELEINMNNEYDKQILTAENYIDDLIEEGALDFVYAEYIDEDDDTIVVEGRYGVIDNRHECFDDSYFDIIYEEL
jgi:hypothetical protein